VYRAHNPEWAWSLQWIPVACWASAGLALAVLAANWARQKLAPAAS
jgi:hypothetical protein